jgi:TolB-like protein
MSRMTAPSKAVFLSYASQDAEAARSICECLRAAGIEVWFDQSELRGGDAWDQKIRQQIHDCALFVPVISAHTDERTEGYFRLEWKLAVDRSHLMADDAAFLFPVVIDDTPDQTARVPDKFRSVQWTRLPGGVAPAAFSQRVAALLAGSAKPVRRPEQRTAPLPRRPRWASWAGWAAAASAVAVLAWWGTHRASPPVRATTTAAASAAPAHSIAVLPFADLSEGQNQAYFSDGLAEELLNMLSKVPGLQVAARTSAFSFKGKATDIPTIARQLVVANVLEGSVRRSGNHLRVSAQLVRADNGYEVWSGVYDRDMGDVFKMQDEIAAAVVKALQLRLLGGGVPRSTAAQSTDAYLVFLQGRAKMATQRLADFRAAAADFQHALKLDPTYGPAYAELASAKLQLAEFEVTKDRSANVSSAAEEAKLLLERALALDPDNAQAYIERGYLRAFTDLGGAEQDYRKALKLDPNSARAYAGLAAILYEDPLRRDEALALLVKARALDPMEPKYDTLRAKILYYARGDIRGADALLSDVVERFPLYEPALVLLAETRQSAGLSADGAMYAEQALKLDPLALWTRLLLINCYADAGDLEAARTVAEESPHQLPIERIRLLDEDGDWHRAAETSYAAIADGTMQLIVEPMIYLAIRMDSRASHDFRRAQALFESRSGVTWSAQGIPRLPEALASAETMVALADMLIESGDRVRAERLLRATLAAVDYAAHGLRKGDFWFASQEVVAMALLGDHRGTIAALKRWQKYANRATDWNVMADPAMKLVNGDPDFQSIQRDVRSRTARERKNLDRLRAEGRIPVRVRAATPGSASGIGTARRP